MTRVARALAQWPITFFARFSTRRTPSILDRGAGSVSRNSERQLVDGQHNGITACETCRKKTEKRPGWHGGTAGTGNLARTICIMFHRHDSVIVESLYISMPALVSCSHTPLHPMKLSRPTPAISNTASQRGKTPLRKRPSGRRRHIQGPLSLRPRQRTELRGLRPVTPGRVRVVVCKHEACTQSPHRC